MSLEMNTNRESVIRDEHEIYVSEKASVIRDEHNTKESQKSLLLFSNIIY